MSRTEGGRPTSRNSLFDAPEECHRWNIYDDWCLIQGGGGVGGKGFQNEREREREKKESPAERTQQLDSFAEGASMESFSRLTHAKQ